MVDARKPAAAGVFYPADPSRLAEAVAAALAHGRASGSARAQRMPRAIVVPHGVTGIAGEVAGAGWARVEVGVSSVRRVLLLGPSHHAPFAGIAAPFADAFATPLGEIVVDRIAIETVRVFPQVGVSDEPHEQEPSLEAQLPFVQRLRPEALIVPLLVGELEDERAADVIDALWDDGTLAVVSTELSQYYDAVEATRVDQATARAIEALDPTGIGEEQACGHAALRALLVSARRRRMKATRLELRQGPAGDRNGSIPPDAEVVGLGAFMLG